MLDFLMLVSEYFYYGVVWLLVSFILYFSIKSLQDNKNPNIHILYASVNMFLFLIIVLSNNVNHTETLNENVEMYYYTEASIVNINNPRI